MTLTKVSYSLITGATVNVLDYGADPTGSADSTSAIQAAIATGLDVYVPDGTFKLTSALTLTTSNQSIFGNGAKSYLKQTISDVNTFYGSGLSNVTISNLRVTPAPGHASVDNAAITFNASNYCVVDNVTVDYNSASAFHGIWLVNSSNNRITNNLFLNAPGTNGVIFTAGGADIVFTELSSYNIIDNNQCVSGNVYGINITTNTNGNTVGNHITNNTVSNCTAYGIILYGGDPNKYIGSSVISNNIVKNITGGALTIVSPPEKWFGAGIYLNGVVNSTISNNVVEDTCLQTTASSLPIGAICGTQNANIVTGNVIRNSSKVGIYFSSGNAASTFPEPINVSAIVSNNIINSTVEDGIKMYNGRRVTVEGNSLYSIGTSGITVDTNGDWLTESHIVDNTIHNAASAVNVNNQSKSIICQNSINSISSSGIGIANTNYAIANENTLQSITINGISIGSTVTSGTVSNNVFNNISNVAIVLSANVYVTNNVFGTVVTRYVGNYAPYQAVVPAVGTWYVTNTVLNSAPAAGQPQGWVCTVAGTPGTWAAMANLV